ncbi:mitochondrial ribosomal protein-like protein [Cenococcum geophilum 1.58]|uniref:mitochondrial ribosomal protein-like protein n=1 Tax=Cenococcum geophilum 1.58 TaxID=794803 RepID=UPI00358F686E|nr:mitochondrial ribosomal protein-like protein [Cenococcum geophilum 1.58]
MAAPHATMRPLTRLKPLFRLSRAYKQQQRLLSTVAEPVQAWTPTPAALTKPRQPVKEIPTFQPPPSARKTCSDPIAAVTSSQLALLDPAGARTRLFSKKNPEAARVGDILLVRLRNGDPFAGVCLNIRRRGIDTGVLLRGQLTRVGVEMWYKVYSPNVEGIEVVQRREKRVRRARLYYMRKPKHDMGSVENIVRQYQRKRAALGTGGSKSKDAAKKNNTKRGRK